MNGFQPNGLPDARHTRIAATRGFVTAALLAFRLSAAARIVEDTNNQICLFAELHKRRDVEFERRRTTIMDADGLAVDVRFAFIVRRAKMQNGEPPCPVGRNRDLAMVEHRQDEILMLHSGQFALRAERNIDLAVEACAFLQAAFATGQAEIKLIRPFAVQIDPIHAFKLRAWVFGTWDRHVFLLLVGMTVFYL